MRRPAGLAAIVMTAWALWACGGAITAESQDRTAEARRMVDAQLRARGIHDERVLAAMLKVPRHRYIPPEMQRSAYADSALPIGYGQTISQPYIVAFMTEALKLEPQDVVLEIGTGSGYQAAILAELAREVYTIEIVAGLAERARRTLEAEGYRNVHVRAGDGYKGWPEHAPFPKIMVTAAPEEVPPALVEQLAVGGTMILPVGPRMGNQELRILTKTGKGVMTERSLPVRFVPMVKPPGDGSEP
ncbi:MAG: protein-L-isoaspartate(D-aspartate) O-methyltransferase [Acidobacteria bacterium]|nr:protein-L-isoaspartate(D-aspartate) O-methyltransferase [Acidobacteriota bacterium]